MADAVSYLENGLKDGLEELHQQDRTMKILEGRNPDELFEAGRLAVRLAVARFAWHDKVGPMLDTAEIGERLGISRQAIAKKVVAGQLLALPGQRTRLFPVWQFSFGPKTNVRPEVAQIIRVFSDVNPDMEPLHIATWARTGQPELDDRAPADWLDEGRSIDPVLVAAGRAAWALAQ